MLGSDRFAFETPNVIDPGDAPPSRPKRNDNTNVKFVGKSSPSKLSPTLSSKKELPSDTKSPTAVVDASYKEARESTARLLRDIGDLELTPATSGVSSPVSFNGNGSNSSARPKAYDPYYDEHNDIEYNNGNHSLPAVEEARMYAASLLSKDENARRQFSSSSSSPRQMASLSISRTVQLDAPSSKHLLRKTLLRRGSRIFVIIAFIVAVIVGVYVAKRDKDDTNTSGNGATQLPPASPPTTEIDDLPPQISPSEQRMQDIVQFLSSTGIVQNETALATPTAPQYLAAQWMALSDPLQYHIPSRLTDSGPSADFNRAESFVQRYLLALLYYSMGGPQWTHRYGFVTAEHECAWFMSLSVPDFVRKETAFGITCNSDLLVVDIFLPDNNLIGKLPEELVHLSHLQMIAIPYNQISGSLPLTYKKMKSIIYFDLRYNDLSGSLPQWLGDLSNLEVLGFSNNDFTGQLPTSLARLGRLKTLALDDNFLSGSIDFANSLISLEYFYADRNMLTGHIDANFLVDLDRLHELDLSSNQLNSSEFPTHLIQHRTLYVLDMADNKIEGSLPDSIAVNYVMEFLSFRGNLLTGPAPSSLVNLVKLNHLDLHGNRLTGYLPNSFGQMSALSYLFLGDNDFTPSNSLPPFLAQLSNLRELSLTKTQLHGPISDWIRNLNQLKLLDLSYNKLSSSIPADIWDLPNLAYLLLDNNKLTGTVPEAVRETTALKALTLHRNDEMRGNMDHVCTSSSGILVLTTDCSSKISCSESCCPECCHADDANCFDSIIGDYLKSIEGMWEFDYERSPFGFDPDVLDEAQLFEILSPGPEDGN